MPRNKPRLSDLVKPTTIQEIVARGDSVFSAPPCMTAFEEWWKLRRNTKLRGKALAKAAFNAAIQELS